MCKSLRSSPIMWMLYTWGGVLAFQTGRNSLAMERLRRAVLLAPNNAAVHSNFGAVCRSSGLLDEALAAFRRALQLDPNFPDIHYNIGVVLSAQSRFYEAIDSYGQALHIAPGHMQALSNLGAALAEVGRYDQAVSVFRQAIATQPDDAKAHRNLGKLLCDLGKIDDAIPELRRALEIKPDYAEALNSLGVALARNGLSNEAEAAYRQTLAIQPDNAEALNNLGVVLAEKSRTQEAIAIYRQVLEISPDAAALNNIGNALVDCGQWDEAAMEFRRALEIQPDYAEALNNLGILHSLQGNFEEAEGAFRRALEIQPEFAAAKLNLSMLLLRRGDHEQGWPLYESRFDADRSLKRDFVRQRWNGHSLEGKSILLHAEQGFGDTIQFVRYAKDVAENSGRIIIECQPPLKTLLETLGQIYQVIPRGDPLPEFDFHCPLMSLPYVFGTKAETIPSRIPYLYANSAKVGLWRDRLNMVCECGVSAPSRDSRLKVGVVWAGGRGSEHPDFKRRDQLKSMQLSQFAPLAAVSGVLFISLQKGPETSQAKNPPRGMTLADWTDELHDFADTAALVDALDLIIGIDTAVAHLTGALGKPMWLLAHYGACWRWGMEGESTSWYPTMRIFRQPKAGDWDSVVQCVTEELRKLVKACSESQ